MVSSRISGVCHASDLLFAVLAEHCYQPSMFSFVGLNPSGGFTCHLEQSMCVSGPCGTCRTWFVCWWELVLGCPWVLRTFRWCCGQQCSLQWCSGLGIALLAGRLCGGKQQMVEIPLWWEWVRQEAERLCARDCGSMDINVAFLSDLRAGMGPATAVGASPMSSWLLQLEKLKHQVSLGVKWCLFLS